MIEIDDSLNAINDMDTTDYGNTAEEVVRTVMKADSSVEFEVGYLKGIKEALSLINGWKASRAKRLVEKCRADWAKTAMDNGWYSEPFCVQVWFDENINVEDSVAHKDMKEDIILGL